MCPRLSPRSPRRSHAWTKDRTLCTWTRATAHFSISTHSPMSIHSSISIRFRDIDTYDQSLNLILGGQEHELQMRTAELIEDNATQALELLNRYATSSRRS